MENYLCTELVRLALDFSIPDNLDRFTIFSLVKVQKDKKKQKQREISKKLRDSVKTIVYAPAIQLPQVAPNAPNTAPALSLVAA